MHQLGMAMPMALAMPMAMAIAMAKATAMAIPMDIQWNRCFKNPLGTQIPNPYV